LSQEQLARRTGLDEGTIAKWEREEHKLLKKKGAALMEFFGWLGRRAFDLETL
jgi:transcriptional regulator with XRE-family HTH domain